MKRLFQFLAPFGPLICLVVACPIIFYGGCDYRKKELVNTTWDWGDEIIEFGTGSEWTAYAKNDPSHWENRSGDWSISGNSVTLSMTVIDPPDIPDWHFKLSSDAKRLTSTDDRKASMTRQ